MQRFLITGGAGFIGAALAKALLDDGHIVMGVDRYDETAPEHPVKRDRAKVYEHQNAELVQCELADFNAMRDLFNQFHPVHVIHLGGQYSVKHSTASMRSYTNSIAAHLNMLELCSLNNIHKLVYASSTWADAPLISLYAALKRFQENSAAVYNHMGMITIGLRYASIYGPWMRPDAGMYIMARRTADKASHSLPYDKSRYSFVHIEDVVRITLACVMEYEKPAVFNVCATDQPWSMADIWHYHEKGKLPEHNAPILKNEMLQQELGQRPIIPMQKGYPDFVQWFNEWYPKHGR